MNKKKSRHEHKVTGSQTKCSRYDIDTNLEDYEILENILGCLGGESPRGIPQGVGEPSGGISKRVLQWHPLKWKPARGIRQEGPLGGSPRGARDILRAPPPTSPEGFPRGIP